jgi:hypothetical protein
MKASRFVIARTCVNSEEFYEILDKEDNLKIYMTQLSWQDAYNFCGLLNRGVDIDQ